MPILSKVFPIRYNLWGILFYLLNKLCNFSDMKCFAFAEYYHMTDKTDSAIVCYSRFCGTRPSLWA